jgi:competence protein ComEC
MVIAPFTIGQRCRAARVIVDRRVLRAQGAHALYIEGLSIRTETVAASRGHRPWVPERTGVKPVPRARAQPEPFPDDDGADENDKGLGGNPEE